MEEIYVHVVGEDGQISKSVKMESSRTVREAVCQGALANGEQPDSMVLVRGGPRGGAVPAWQTLGDVASWPHGLFVTTRLRGVPAPPPRPSHPPPPTTTTSASPPFLDIALGDSGMQLRIPAPISANERWRLLQEAQSLLQQGELCQDGQAVCSLATPPSRLPALAGASASWSVRAARPSLLRPPPSRPPPHPPRHSRGSRVVAEAASESLWQEMCELMADAQYEPADESDCSADCSALAVLRDRRPLYVENAREAGGPCPRDVPEHILARVGIPSLELERILVPIAGTATAGELAKAAFASLASSRARVPTLQPSALERLQAEAAERFVVRLVGRGEYIQRERPLRDVAVVRRAMRLRVAEVGFVLVEAASVVAPPLRLSSLLHRWPQRDEGVLPKPHSPWLRLVSGEDEGDEGREEEERLQISSRSDAAQKRGPRFSEEDYLEMEHHLAKSSSPETYSEEGWLERKVDLQVLHRYILAAPSRPRSLPSSSVGVSLGSGLEVVVQKVENVLDHIDAVDASEFRVEASLHYGGRQIGSAVSTAVRDIRGSLLEFDETLTLLPHVPLAHLPPAAHVRLVLVAMRPKDDLSVAFAHIRLTEADGRLTCGPYRVACWEGPPRSTAPCSDRSLLLESEDPEAISSRPIRLFLHFLPAFDPPPILFREWHAELFDAPSFHTQKSVSKGMSWEEPPTSRSFVQQRRANLQAIGTAMRSTVEDDSRAAEEVLQLHRRREPWQTLSGDDTEFVWARRESCAIHAPDTLSLVCSATNWEQPNRRITLYRLLRSWRPLTPLAALQVLGPWQADPAVRRVAVASLALASDAVLGELAPSLAAALMHEPFEDGPLHRLLLVRALRARGTIGQPLFWHLRALAETPWHRTRARSLLQALAREGGAEWRHCLVRQTRVFGQLRRLAQKVRARSALRKRGFVSELEQISLAGDPVCLPLDAAIRVSALEIDGCHVMGSATSPLWLRFRTMDGESVCVLLKDGEDVRQDAAVVQALRSMDGWMMAASGAELCLTSYGIMPLGKQAGLIEIVPRSFTTAQIQKDFGGASAALLKTPLAAWLRQHNPAERDYEAAVAVFVTSLAAYCVGTWLLGVGDRHNDNVLVRPEGFLFHIDFSHILGNVQKFGPVSRDRAPFLLTPEFLHVLGGDSLDNPLWLRFRTLCGAIYLEVRKFLPSLLASLAVWVDAELAELNSLDALAHIRKCARPEDSDAAALDHLNKALYKSARNWAAQLNNWVHNMVH